MLSARTRYPNTAYPFTDDLCAFMDAHPAFERSLKVTKPARFDLIRCLIVSRLPDGYSRSADEVLGFWYLDKKWLLEGKPFHFKQDIVVNQGGTGKVFYSYTFEGIVKELKSPYVLPIQKFYDDYSENGKFYIRPGIDPSLAWPHRFPDETHLPPELQREALQLKQACLGLSGAT